MTYKEKRLEAIEKKIDPPLPCFYCRWGSDEEIPRPRRELTWKEVMGGKGPDEPYTLSGFDMGIPQ